jgi:DHA1 family multidrug resistance protein-like MFS transporter
MGLSNAFVSMGRIVGPIWAGAVYELNSSYPYWSGAVILSIVFVLSWRWVGAKRVGAASEAGA